MPILVFDGMAGGVRCRQCGGVDTHFILTTQIIWDEEILLHFCQCRVCTYDFIVKLNFIRCEWVADRTYRTLRSDE